MNKRAMNARNQRHPMATNVSGMPFYGANHIVAALAGTDKKHCSDWIGQRSKQTLHLHFNLDLHCFVAKLCTVPVTPTLRTNN
jgi:hypothetical protein